MSLKSPDRLVSESQANIVPINEMEYSEKEGPPKEAAAAAAATKKRKLLFVGAGLLTVGVILAIVLGVLASQNKLGGSNNKSSGNKDSSSDSSSGDSSSSSSNSTSKMACGNVQGIPSNVVGTYLDMNTWRSSLDFNCTWTNETVGGLSIAGLNSTWNNDVRANEQVPYLNTSWGSYTDRPARGVNIGGWLALEPFITPSLFNYSSDVGVIDEWTLTAHLGDQATAVLEEHYDTFITEDDFRQIAAAGLDHVRIPFSYWAVTTYDGDSYVTGTSWRYLLRGIEWARKYGLRVNLDLHGLPGSQNGWNHSGRAGNITWILSDEGATNRQRSLDIHEQLATFFAQDRYKNIISFYGLANEPGSKVPTDELTSWTSDAYSVISGAGISVPQVMSDGIRSLDEYYGTLSDISNTSLPVDTHPYAVFTQGLLNLTRDEKISYACQSWKGMASSYMEQRHAIVIGEFSAADTDCTVYLNGFDVGNRWDGSFSSNEGAQWCPTSDSQCTCDVVNGEISKWPAKYISFLKSFTIGQMEAWEQTWGWFYWTWKTESAPLFDYQKGLEYGYLPKVAYDRDWSCSDDFPDLTGLPEYQ